MLCTPFTQWFCWSLSLLNGYNWGYTPFSDIPTLCHISRLILGKKNRLRWFHQAMSSNIYMLVGGLEHEFYFPFHIWDVILPIDSYFSRWLKPPTRHAWVFEFHGHYIYIYIYIFHGRFHIPNIQDHPDCLHDHDLHTCPNGALLWVLGSLWVGVKVGLPQMDTFTIPSSDN